MAYTFYLKSECWMVFYGTSESSYIDIITKQF